MRELLFQYADKFEQNFPMFLFDSLTDEEIVEKLKKALDEGKPIEPEYEEGATY